MQRLVVEEEEEGSPCGVDGKVDGQADVEDVVDHRAEEDPYGEGVVGEEEEVGECKQQDHYCGSNKEVAQLFATLSSSLREVRHFYKKF